MAWPATSKVTLCIIALRNQSCAYEEADIHLWSINENRNSSVAPSSSLRFLSTVYVQSIPLYLAVGPSSEVSTSNADTAAWLHNKLIPETTHIPKTLDFGSDAPRQLNIGILLGVEDVGFRSEVTELLLYAEVHDREQDLSIPAHSSPPLLSSEMLPDPPTNSSILLKVYALPLCSSVITQARTGFDRAATTLPSSHTPSGLPDGQGLDLMSHKRKRLTDLFDDATQQRQKFNGRGGERISRAMSDAKKASSEKGPTVMSGKQEVVDAANRASRSLSRASSVTIENNAPMNPTSQGPLTRTKRSSLHRVESALLPLEASAACDYDNDFAKQNKAALAKVVLAGMRVYGLEQRKKRAFYPEIITDSNRLPPSAASDRVKDGAEEYKLIYHQTFKAATFAFRAHLSIDVLGQDIMRDVVDRLLILFCTDLVATKEHEEGFPKTPGSVLRSNAFDLPSNKKPPRSTPGTRSTLVTKKRP